MQHLPPATVRMYVIEERLESNDTTTAQHSEYYLY